MTRTRTRTNGDSDENGQEADQSDSIVRGKRRRGREQDHDKQSNGIAASKRSRYGEDDDGTDLYADVPRRSTRKILRDTQIEYDDSVRQASPVFDTELSVDDDFSDDKHYRRERSRSSSHRPDRYGRHSKRKHSNASHVHRHIDREDPEGDGDDDDEDDDDAGEGVRRSGRQRHTHFQSLNMSAISKELLKKDMEMVVEQRLQRQRAKARRRSDDLEDNDEGEEDDDGEEEEEEGESSELEVIEVEVDRRRPGLRPRTVKVEARRNAKEETDHGEEEEEEEESLPPRRDYFLRKEKKTVQRYQAEVIKMTRKHRDRDAQFIHSSPARRRRFHSGNLSNRSPAKKHSSPHHHRAHHDSSSTSSASSGDERDFDRRKSRSMRKARDRCLPMNFTQDDLRTHTVARDRLRVGASLADIDPMSIDRSTSFDSVGGLQDQVSALKEMVVFPLLYPEVFSQFGIQPPRGVLFHGPPGTGKTLVARALANECGTLAGGQQRVAFFMRKGADCLSKWVGESERQLRLLFDQAYSMRPSIIFFDEIDGLAPVRSTRQDQIHSSIVSTLLALMDGLDSRGEVVIIGATNRIDSIDPALRRPGRFDREFRFPLPDRECRRQIIRINTKEWKQQLSDEFVSTLADRTVGYCGADVKALCSEVALCALRRTYPQIYSARDKLLLDMSKIRIEAHDFATALGVVVPTTARSQASPSWPLRSHVMPLLSAALSQVSQLAQVVFPSCKEVSPAADSRTAALSTLGSAFSSLSGIPMYAGEDGGVRGNACASGGAGSLPSFTLPHRPRLLLYGPAGCGVCEHIAPALLHQLERLPTHTLDMSTLYSVTAHGPEEASAQVIREAARTAPSVLYLPRLHLWWSSLSSTVHATIRAQLFNISPSTPLFVLATAEGDREGLLDEGVMDIFSDSSSTVLRRSLVTTQQSGGIHEPFVVAADNRTANLVSMPKADERESFFKPMLVSWLVRPLPSAVVSTRGAPTPAVLPVAPPPEPRQLSAVEQHRLLGEEEKHLRELRIFLRDCTNKLLMERKFKPFCKPVDLEEAPDYLEVVKDPLDLEMIMHRIDARQYTSARAWLKDIHLISSNCIEYNPPTNQKGKSLRNRACALNDVAASLIDIEMSQKFEDRCIEIEESRRKRGYVGKAAASPGNGASARPPQQLQRNGAGKDGDHGVRRSLRVHGIQPDDPDDIVKTLGTPTKNSAPHSNDRHSAAHSAANSPGNSAPHLLASSGSEGPSVLASVSNTVPRTTRRSQRTGCSDSDSSSLVSANCRSSWRRRASHDHLLSESDAPQLPLADSKPSQSADSGLGGSLSQSRSDLCALERSPASGGGGDSSASEEYDSSSARRASSASVLLSLAGHVDSAPAALKCASGGNAKAGDSPARSLADVAQRSSRRLSFAMVHATLAERPLSADENTSDTRSPRARSDSPQSPCQGAASPILARARSASPRPPVTSVSAMSGGSAASSRAPSPESGELPAGSPPVAQPLLEAAVMEDVLLSLVASTAGYCVIQLESVHAALSQLVQTFVQQRPLPTADSIVEDLSNFCSQLGPATR